VYGFGATLQYPSIDAAIQNFEGYAPGTLAYQNNNPGNLVYASWESAYGCTPGGAGGFALCPTYEAGQEIQDHLVSTYVDQGDSLSELLAAWSPPTAPGNSQASYNNYVSSVASSTGLDPSLPISQQVNDSGTVDTSSTDTGIDLSSLLGTDSGPDWGTIALVAAGVLAVFLVAS
jgi:hypothetical protein